MISEKLREVLGRNNDLGNLLHTHYIYNCGKEDQIIARAKLEALLKHYKRFKHHSDEGLLGLAFDENSEGLLAELIALKKEPNWQEIITKILEGLSHLLDRELEKAQSIPKPAKVEEEVIKELVKIHIYHPDDRIEVTEKDGIVLVHYLSMQHSPEYDEQKKSYYGKFEPWRDTEMIFQLNFNKNLFIWEYLNVHESLRNKGMGTKLVQFAEELGKSLGFTRFTVEYPNRKYWRKMGYNVPEKCIVGEKEETSYTHEAYKEI